MLPDVGEDRAPVGGRGVDHGQVADAGEGHLERARDRAGRERKHVDPLGHALDRLLVAHAEALLLVDHQEPEVLEPHVLGQEPVGADDHVDRPVGQPLHDGTLLGGREEAAEHLHADRIGRVALGDGLRVLAGQERRRREDGGLRPLLHRLEHRPHRHLRLAEPDVAAHEPVHGAWLLHVALDVCDGRQLIVGLDEAEGRLHLRLPRRVGAEGAPRYCQPPSVELHQFGRHLAGRRPGLGTGALPVGAAHLGERRRLPTRVRREGVDLVDGEVEPVGAPELQDQVVPRRPAHGARRDPLEARRRRAGGAPRNSP